MGAPGHLKRELLSTIVEITTVARTHFVPGDNLSDLPALSHLSLSATPCERNYGCVHFLETEGHTATKQKTQDSRQGSPTLQPKSYPWPYHFLYVLRSLNSPVAVAYDPRELLSHPFLNLPICIFGLQEGCAEGGPVKEKSVLWGITEGSLMPSLAVNIQKSGESREPGGQKKYRTAQQP